MLCPTQEDCIKHIHNQVLKNILFNKLNIQRNWYMSNNLVFYNKIHHIKSLIENLFIKLLSYQYNLQLTQPYYLHNLKFCLMLTNNIVKRYQLCCIYYQQVNQGHHNICNIKDLVQLDKQNKMACINQYSFHNYLRIYGKVGLRKPCIANR